MVIFNENTVSTEKGGILSTSSIHSTDLFNWFVLCALSTDIDLLQLIFSWILIEYDQVGW